MVAQRADDSLDDSADIPYKGYYGFTHSENEALKEGEMNNYD